LFARDGVKSVGVDLIIARSGVSKMTLYRHFPSKEDLILAFLDLREDRWTVNWLKAGVEQRTSDRTERLLVIFDLYHEWFGRPDFEGNSFTRVVLESPRGSAIHNAAANHLAHIRDYVTELAIAAGLADAAAFGTAWQMLMEGAMVSAFAGNRNAALQAKRAATVMLNAWPRTSRPKKSSSTNT
jgi:AcrR family transcriptional regulator